MTESKPLVSIGIPVYNGERFIRETLDSIVGQTFENTEIIISDNASIDGTEEICREYAGKDRRIRYVRNAINIGSAPNFNQVVMLSSGQYFKLANADDLSAPDLVARCFAVLDHEKDVALCYGRTSLIDESGRELGPYEDRLDLRSPDVRDRFRLVLREIGLVNVLQGVVRSDALRRTGLLGSYLGSDVILVAELALYGQFRELPDRLFFRRMHGAAFSSLKTDESRRAYVDPRRQPRITLYWWRHYLEYMRAIVRAPLAAGVKRGLVYDVVRRGISARRTLLRELVGGVGQMVGKPPFEKR